MRKTGIVAATIALACGTPVMAADNVTYTYDALGRLVSVSTTGSPNDNILTTITLDAADNRTGYTVTGAVAQGPMPTPTSLLFGNSTPSRFIVVPIAHMALIPFP